MYRPRWTSSSRSTPAALAATRPQVIVERRDYRLQRRRLREDDRDRKLLVETSAKDVEETKAVHRVGARREQVLGVAPRAPPEDLLPRLAEHLPDHGRTSIGASPPAVNFAGRDRLADHGRVDGWMGTARRFLLVQRGRDV